MLLINGTTVNYFKFSGGELQVKVPLEIRGDICLEWKPKSSDDIMLLLLTIDALNRNFNADDIHLKVYYLPYARQDRVCAAGEAFSLQVMLKILMNLYASEITFYDVHNPEVLKILNQSFKPNGIYYNLIEIDYIFSRYKQFLPLKNIVICSPDKGAERRARLASIELNKPCMFFLKERNPDTGEIISIFSDRDYPFLKGKEILVVDDICDGGATFILLAKELRKITSNPIYLYVTHGIFSKGLDGLSKHYSHIYCHHVLDDSKYKSNEFLTIFKEFPHD